MQPSALQQATQVAQQPQQGGQPIAQPQQPQQGGQPMAQPQSQQSQQSQQPNPAAAQQMQQVLGGPNAPQMPQMQPQPQPQNPNQGGLSADVLFQMLQNPQILAQLIHMGIFTMVNGQLSLAGMQDANKTQPPKSDNEMLNNQNLPSNQHIQGSSQQILNQLQQPSSGGGSNPGYGAGNASALASMSNTFPMGGVNTTS